MVLDPARVAAGHERPGWRCPPQCRTQSNFQCRSPTPTNSPGPVPRRGRRSCAVQVEGYLCLVGTGAWTGDR